MATRRRESELDVVQSDAAGPSVLIPYPGSVLPSSPIALAPVVAKPAVPAADDAFDEDAEESDDSDAGDSDDEDTDDTDSDDDDSDDDDSDDDDSDDDADEGGTTRSAAAAAFMKAMTPSPQLAAVVGSEPITRVEVIKRVWEYIKKNGLQDSKNRRMIKVDATLKGVFGDTNEVNMFEMTQLIMRHLT